MEGYQKKLYDGIPTWYYSALHDTYYIIHI